jgi:hypothetical protein
MADNKLVKKLRLLPGQRALIMKAPDGYIQLIGDLPEGVEIFFSPEGVFDFVILFVNNVAEFETIVPLVVKAGRYDCILWVAYPKQSSGVRTDIHRDVAWKLAEKIGLRPVSQIALDETWSALRFRPAERVGV